jgi:hypothetical protein
MPDPTELGQVLDQVIASLEEQAQPQPQRIARSECCGARAVTAGKPGSTQWHVCPHCCEPCDVYYHDSKPTQPQPQPANTSKLNRVINKVTGAELWVTNDQLKIIKSHKNADKFEVAK